MKRIMPGFLSLACVLFLGIAQAEASLKLKAQVTGYDALTHPGTAVSVSAQVAWSGILFFHPHIHGTTVKFYAGGALVGSATTGDEGMATISFVPTTTGYTIITAKVVSSWLEGNDARIVVGSFPATAKFLVTDIDKTIAMTNELSFLFSSNPADTAPMPYSVEALMFASAHGWQVIYLTARDHSATVKTKDWELLNHYPVGCSFFKDVNLGNLLSSEKYKQDKIAALKGAGFPNIKIGVGNMPSDAQAYLANGMAALILPGRDTFGDPFATFPSATTYVSNWLKVEPYLLP